MTELDRNLRNGHRGGGGELKIGMAPEMKYNNTGGTGTEPELFA